MGYIAFWLDASLVRELEQRPVWEQFIVGMIQIFSTGIGGLIALHLIIMIWPKNDIIRISLKTSMVGIMTVPTMIPIAAGGNSAMMKGRQVGENGWSGCRRTPMVIWCAGAIDTIVWSSDNAGWHPYRRTNVWSILREWSEICHIIPWYREGKSIWLRDGYKWVRLTFDCKMMMFWYHYNIAFSPIGDKVTVPVCKYRHYVRGGGTLRRKNFVVSEILRICTPSRSRWSNQWSRWSNQWSGKSIFRQQMPVGANL